MSSFILKLHQGREQRIHAPESLLARSFSLCLSLTSVLTMAALSFTRRDLIPPGICCLVGNYDEGGGRTTLSTANCWERPGLVCQSQRKLPEQSFRGGMRWEVQHGTLCAWPCTGTWEAAASPAPRFAPSLGSKVSKIQTSHG